MFNWFKNIFRSSGPIRLTREELNYLRQRGSPSAAGIHIDKEALFSLPAFEAGCELIAKTVARTPCIVYERQANGARRRAVEHPAYKLLNGEANKLMVPFYNVMYQLTHDLLWNHNGYASIEKSGADPIEIYTKDARNVKPVVTNVGLKQSITYDVTAGSEVINVPLHRIIHVKTGQTRHSGLVGIPLTESKSDAIGWCLAVMRYGSYWFRNGGALGSTVIEVPAAFKNEEAKALFRKSLDELHAGIDSVGRPVILDGGAKLNRSPIGNDEAQYIESMERVTIFCAQLLGLNPGKLGALINSSYGAVAEENLSLLSDLYDGIFSNIEQELNAKLLRENQKGTYYIEFLRDALLRANTTANNTDLINQYNNGCISWEEYRALKNMTTEKDTNQTWRVPSGVTVEGQELPGSFVQVGETNNGDNPQGDTDSSKSVGQRKD